MKATPKISLLYIVICVVAVFVTFFFHELAHWTVGRLVGFEMGLRLNLAFPLKEYNNIVFNDIVWVVAAGPLFTLLQAFVFYLIQRKSDNPLWYPFLLTPFYMRLLAALISFKNLNDEANISKETGIGAATLPILMCLILFLLNYDIARRKKYSAWFIIGSFLPILIFSSILVLTDMYLKIRVL